jgi:GNAT superfamily N-acetyltransferase
MMEVRLAVADDAEVLAALVAACLEESYPGHPGTSPAALARDVFAPPPPPAAQPRVALSLDDRGTPRGYIAWDATYDLHWASAGAHISDLYVAPAARGLGVAAALVAYCCATVRAAGGVYLRGEAYDRPSTRRLYGRIAVLQASGEVALGGRAFRRMAELAGASPRVILAGLPPVAWNHEV